jgi:uncharacterized protein
MSLNVFGEPLHDCSVKPLTGFFRDGCCNTNEEDGGVHVTCVVVTEEFLKFSYLRGNDLISPRLQFDFPGLHPGDKWCLCASRWIEAYKANVAPKIFLEATHEKMLEYIELEELVKFAYVPVNK